MNKVLFAAVSILLGATLTAQAAPRCEVVMAADTKVHHYVVQFKIHDVAKDGQSEILSLPNLTVKAGEEGKVNLISSDARNGVYCTAFVKETKDAIEATTTILVKENNLEKINMVHVFTHQR